MTLGYEQARAACEAAPDDEFNLPDYTGSPTDSDYLKNYVLSAVTSIYNVSADIFDTATVYSTTILRDFVHRAISQELDRENISEIDARGGLVAPQTEDVATALRYPAWGACGLLSWQEYQVFHSFGYQTRLLAFMNGDMGEYTDSHVSTEVYCEDIGKSIVQDATFNFVFEDADGNLLSWLEARDAAAEGVLRFDNFDVYTYYRSLHEPQTGPFPSDIESIFLGNYFKVPFLWANNGEEPGTDGSLYQLFPNTNGAHDPSVYQGGTYASAESAVADVLAARERGLSWSEIADALNDAHYATGFRVGASEWITVRLDTGDYLSINIRSGDTLNGSYDQLVNEATGGPDLNSADVSFLIQPADVIDFHGNIMNDWADPIPQVDVLTMRSASTGALKVWSLDGTADAALSFGNPDKAYVLVDRADYDGDGHIDPLFFNQNNGQVGYWDENQSWHRLDALSSAWRVETHNGHSDFSGDTHDDILWRNTSTGQVVIWDMTNGVKDGYKSFGVVGLNWQVIGTADFNNDGHDDILWRDQNTGAIREWLMEDGAVMSNKGVDTVVNTWSILGVGDFEHDGSADILWRNTSTLEVGYWDMENGLNSGFHHFDNLPMNWQVVAIADTNADGSDDVLWRNNNTGDIINWQMHNGVQTAAGQGTLISDWMVV